MSQVLTRGRCFRFGLKEVCTYCGEFANSIDHIIPRGWLADGDDGITTYACMSCNSSLSDDVFYKFFDRMLFIHNRGLKRLNKKVISKSTYYKNVYPLRGKRWTKKALGELDYTLRMEVIRLQDEGRKKKRQVQWIKSRKAQKVFETLYLWFERHEDKELFSYFREFLPDEEIIDKSRFLYKNPEFYVKDF